MNAPETRIELPVIGMPFAGGFFAGRYFIGAEPRALIVAPKAEGDIAPTIWAAAMSYCDGTANTLAMVEAGSELAAQVRALRIGGFEDWHLPSRLELMTGFLELAAVKEFTEDGPEAFEWDWYWTSTQDGSDADYAWIQGPNGGQHGSHKGDKYRARAVRSIKII